MSRAPAVVKLIDLYARLAPALTVADLHKDGRDLLSLVHTNECRLISAPSQTQWRFRPVDGLALYHVMVDRPVRVNLCAHCRPNVDTSTVGD